MTPAPPGRVAALLRERRCLAFILARAASQTGSWIERLSLGWLAWEASGSTAWLGVIAFVRLAPAVLLAPWGGLLCDRSGSGPVLRVAISASVAIGLALTAVAPRLEPEWLAFAALLLGALQAVAGAPSKAAVSELAPRELLATVVPLNAAGLQTAAFVGPAVGGGLIALWGAQAAFLTAALTHLAFLAFLLSIGGLTRGRAGAGTGGAGAILEVLQHAREHIVLRNIFLLHAGVSLLLRPLVDMMPAIVGDMASGGPDTLGLFTGAIGFGAMLGSVWLVWRGTGSGLVAWMVAGAVAAAAAVLGVVATELSVPVALFFILFGAGMVVRAAGAQTVIQLIAREDFRGRLLGGYTAVSRVCNALGGLAVGVFAEVLGLDAILVGLSGLCLMAALAVGWALRGGVPADGR